MEHLTADNTVYFTGLTFMIGFIVGVIVISIHSAINKNNLRKEKELAYQKGKFEELSELASTQGITIIGEVATEGIRPIGKYGKNMSFEEVAELVKKQQLKEDINTYSHKDLFNDDFEEDKYKEDTTSLEDKQSIIVDILSGHSVPIDRGDGVKEEVIR